MEKVPLGFLANIFKRRSPDEIIARSNTDSLAKTLNWTDILILGISAVIGSGIFVMVGEAACGNAEHVGAGPALVFSVFLGALACIFPAFCFAEFASTIPDSGSSYTYTYSTLGEFPAWIMGTVLVLEYAISNVTVSAAWSGYFFQFLEGFSHVLPDWLVHPPLWLIHDYGTAVLKYQAVGLDPNVQIPHVFGIPIAFNLPAIFIMIVMAIILTRGMLESKRTATLMVIIKMLVIFLFIGVGMFYVQPDNWGHNFAEFAPNGFEGITIGAFIIVYAYLGFDALGTTAGESKNPQKDLPIGIIGTLLIAALVYAGVAAVFTGIVPASDYATVNIHAPLAYVSRLIHQDWIAGWISLGALAGLTSVLLVLQYANSRILYAMAKDNFLPKILKKRHPKYKTPAVIIWLSAIVIIVSGMFIDMSVATQLAICGTLTCFVLVCLEIIILRKTHPHINRPFRVPFYPLFPILGIIVSALLMIQSLPQLEKASFLFPLWLLGGALIYTVYGYRQHRKAEEKDKMLKQRFMEKTQGEENGGQ